MKANVSMIVYIDLNCLSDCIIHVISVLCLLCLVRICLFMPCNLTYFVVTCWERADLLALVCDV